MKILMMPPYFFPEQMSSTHLEHDRLMAYSQQGIEVEVVTPMPTRGVSGEVRKEYKNKKNEVMFNGYVRVNRFSMFREGKNPIFRALRYFLSNIIQYCKATKLKGIDVIYSGSTPPIQGLLCGRVKKRLTKRYGRQVPFVYCLQDIFPDSLVNAKMTHEGSILWKVGRWIENYTYRSADKIIVISEKFKQNIMKKGVNEEKIIIIPNWIDSEKVYPVERMQNKLFDLYDLDRSKFYVTYSGNIGHSQNMELLAKVAKEMQVINPQIQFVVIGEGAAKEKLSEMIQKEKITNFKLLPFQPAEDMAYVFSLGDIGLIISKPGIGGSSVPSKTWSIMAAGKPVLASFDLDSDLSEMIKNIQCGVTVRAGDKEALIDAINHLYNCDCQNMGYRGREYVVTELNASKCTGMYIDVLEKTVNV